VHILKTDYFGIIKRLDKLIGGARMRLTLRQLKIFESVALHGSTSAAARSVPLSQSATSAAVNELEHVLQTRLFDRRQYA
jgi:molybdenum-dependent DNA-binding transcriptional regulator ModE